MLLHPFLPVLLISLGPVLPVIFQFKIIHGLFVSLLPQQGTADTDVSKVVIAV